MRGRARRALLAAVGVASWFIALIASTSSGENRISVPKRWEGQPWSFFNRYAVLRLIWNKAATSASFRNRFGSSSLGVSVVASILTTLMAVTAAHGGRHELIVGLQLLERGSLNEAAMLSFRLN
jgi:hypothetical protein